MSPKLAKEDLEFGAQLERLKRIFLTNVRWFTRAGTAFLLILVVLHRIYPPAVEWAGDLIGIKNPSLVSVMSLILLVFVVERLVVLEDRLLRPTIQLFETRADAYGEIAALLERKPAARVDLIQFSGQTALDLIRRVAESSPRAKLRLLLHQPEETSNLDVDKHPDHARRTSVTVDQVAIYEDDFEGFQVNIFYYKTPASVSSVVIDDDLVALGWYHYYQEGGVLRLRGHNAPTILARGSSGAALRSFAGKHFAKLLVHAVPARKESEATEKEATAL